MCRASLIFLLFSLFVIASRVTGQSMPGGGMMSGAAYLLPHRDSASSKAFVNDYINSGWDDSKLQGLTRSPFVLHSNCIYLPLCKPAVISSSFMLKGADVSGSVVLYRGTVIAPESGWFRFVGMGDDRLVVRFGEKVVLDATSERESAPQKTPGRKGMFASVLKTQGKIKVSGAETWNRNLEGLTVGSPFHVEQGKKYAISVLYSNYSGNAGYALLIQRGKKMPSAGKLKRQLGIQVELDLFRTSGNMPDRAQFAGLLSTNAVGNQMEWIEFRENSMVWPATAEAPDASLNRDDVAPEPQRDGEKIKDKTARKDKKKKRRKKGKE